MRLLRPTILIVLALAACSESPVDPIRAAAEPAAAPVVRAGTTLNAEGFRVVVRRQAGPGERIQARIGPAGGVLAAAGVVFMVPPGALAEERDISMTVPAAGTLSVQFEPHGLQFLRPATLAFWVHDTEIAGSSTALLGAYHRDPLDATQIAPLELMPVRRLGGFAAFSVNHFSIYSLLRGGLILVGG